MAPRGARLLLAAAALAAATCSDDEACESPCRTPTTLLMSYAGGESFFDAPFPSDARRDASGKPIVTGFPNPQGIFLVDRVLEIVEEADGFGISSGIFFRATAELDPGSLPSLAGSVDEAASVQLLGVDETSPDYLVRYPVRSHFAADPGPFGAENLLSIIPLQGMPLRPKTRYAVVITRGVRDAEGEPLAPSPSVADLLSGKAPQGMTAEAAAGHRVFAALEAGGVRSEDIVALTVFTTGDPVSTMGRAIENARQNDLPSPSGPFARTDELPT